MDRQMTIKEQSMEWYRNNKFIIGVALVVLSFILGFWGKVLIIVRFYEPIQLITGLSIYAFSFVLLFIGILLVGWQTVKMIQYRIRYHVKATMKKTYHQAKKIPKKAGHYTRRLQRKSMDKLADTSKAIVERIKKKND